MVPNYEFRLVNDDDFHHVGNIITDGSPMTETTIDINPEKLSRYVQFVSMIRVRSLKDDFNYYIKNPMVTCKEEWFKGVIVKHLEKRLCPDLDNIPADYWILQGDYDHKEYRVSISIEAHTCRNNPDCKSDNEVREMLKRFYVTEYMLQKNSNLFNADKEPVQILNSFQQQFIIDFDKYHDNNNFVEIDLVNVKDNRVNFLQGGDDYEAFKVQRGPSWLSARQSKHNQILLPNGTYITETAQMVFGTYFFYSQTMIESSREVFTWPFLLSDFAGLQVFLLYAF